MDEAFQQAMATFDQINQTDPCSEISDGKSYPKELLYAQRMSARLAKFAPNASESLQLAARAQHIKRWHIPRNTYPQGTLGYRRWRSDLANYHADTAESVMKDVGYDDTAITRVRDLLLKKRLRQDAEAQTLEDVICLVFMEYYLPAFAHKHPEDKLVDIIHKTWKKMSSAAQSAALSLPLSPPLATIVGKALG